MCAPDWFAAPFAAVSAGTAAVPLVSVSVMTAGSLAGRARARWRDGLGRDGSPALVAAASSTVLRHSRDGSPFRSGGSPRARRRGPPLAALGHRAFDMAA